MKKVLLCLFLFPLLFSKAHAWSGSCSASKAGEVTNYSGRHELIEYINAVYHITFPFEELCEGITVPDGATITSVNYDYRFTTDDRYYNYNVNSSSPYLHEGLYKVWFDLTPAYLTTSNLQPNNTLETFGHYEKNRKELAGQGVDQTYVFQYRIFLETRADGTPCSVSPAQNCQSGVTVFDANLTVNWFLDTSFVIDNNSSNFSATTPIVLLHGDIITPIVISEFDWKSRTDTDSYQGNDFISIPSGDGKMSVTWNFIPEYTGKHEVCLYIPIPDNDNLNTKAQYTLYQGGNKLAMVEYDQSVSTGGWECFANKYSFNKDEPSSIVLTNTGNNITVADAVKVNYDP